MKRSDCNNYWVTIAVPVYNVENYLERCARSLFYQSYKNIKYYFVNDGCTDGSLDVLTRVVDEFPQRKPYVKIHSFHENKGLANVRNYLVEHCTTDWIIHVDSDDWIELDFVDHLVNKQKITGADIVMSGHVHHYHDEIRKFEPNECGLKSDYLKLFLSNIQAHHIWGKLIRHSLYMEHSIRVTKNCVIAEDLQAFIPLAYYAEHFAVLHEYGYHYEHDRMDRISVKSRERVREKGMGMIDTLSSVRSFVCDKMPDNLRLFDNNISLYYYVEFITLALVFGEKDLHREMCQKEKDLIRMYPSMHGNLVGNLKRRVKYNYRLSHPLMWLKWQIQPYKEYGG